LVIDEHRGFANGWMLPAGPLREPVSRLASVDVIALHQTGEAAELSLPDAVPRGRFHLRQSGFRVVHAATEADQETSLTDLCGQVVHAMAGIGDPERFFKQLEAAGLKPIRHPMPDHHVWTCDDLMFDDDHPIVMTAKDAVKVQALLSNAVGIASIFEVSVVAEWDADLAKAVSELEQRLFAAYRQPLKG